MKITHYDLFAGIGGFSLALDTIFYEQEIEHIFCEWEAFPTAVLKKHWPDATYYGDIADLVTDTEHQRLERGKQSKTPGHPGQCSGERSNQAQNLTVLTGGFPCQPFSHAGRRQGTSDDRPDGTTLPSREQCGNITAICNGDTTTSVQDARKDRNGQSNETENQSTEGTAIPVQQFIKRSGEQETRNGDGRKNENGRNNTRTRFSPDTEGSANAVARRSECSSQSTTPTEGGTRNGESTTTKHGDSSSRTDTQRTSTKSFATTATTPNTDSDSAPTRRDGELVILTGGFPCQPFSHAGRRQGTSDERYKWPEMFAVIQNVKPDWVIAENVRGLVTWNEGMVLETVCTDLESEGYEVQPFIIPAVAIGAPHRRDRVWIVAHNKSRRWNEWTRVDSERNGNRMDNNKKERSAEGSKSGRCNGKWTRDWREVAFASCDGSLDDGLPRDMAGLTISYAKYRRESLKAVGNSIVPQVAMQIFEAIKYANKKI